MKPSFLRHLLIITGTLMHAAFSLLAEAPPASSPADEKASPVKAVAIKTEESLKREEVTFQHGAIALSGDLLTPPGPGPFPVFIWCHGSGMADRKGGLFFARTLVNAGYAFLTWDKPGVGKSSGEFYPQSLSDRAGEVLAAADMLMQRKDIDAGRVSFCGASQAGYVLPRVIRAFPRAEKLVLIGPGSWSFREERAYQQQKQPIRNYLPRCGVTDQNEIDEIMGLYGKVYDASDADFFDAYLRFYQEAKGKSWYPKVKILIPPPPARVDALSDFKLLWQEGFAFDAVQEYSGISCPTLILFGEKDECVNPKVGIPNIRAGFMKSGNTQLSVIVYPDANHSLNGAGEKPKRDLADWLAHSTPSSGEK